MPRTGIVISEKYMDHRVPPAHPERPERIGVLLDWAKSAPGKDLLVMEPVEAKEEKILSVHGEYYLDLVRSSEGKDEVYLDPDTYASPGTYRTALLAAGGFLELIDAVMAGEIANGIALVRPPGHHAEADHAMGFCLFNNAAIGAAHLRDAHGLERIMVVDWDLHHGNGTQRIFYGEKTILYLSLHQHPCYPGTGRIDECGEGEGEGFTVNVPLPPGMGDEEYLAAFERVVLPIARAFSPEFILISAGFDPHASDPLGGMRLGEGGFALMTRMLMQAAVEAGHGRVAAVLEGGYDLEALRLCVAAVVLEMAGRSVDRPAACDASVPEALESVIEVQRRYWDI